MDFSYQDYAEELKNTDAAFGHIYPPMSLPPKRIKADGKQLSEWINEGDMQAKRVYDEFISSLAFLIFNIQITLAPQKIVVGGGLSRLPGCLLYTSFLERPAQYSTVCGVCGAGVYSHFTGHCLYAERQYPLESPFSNVLFSAHGHIYYGSWPCVEMDV